VAERVYRASNPSSEALKSNYPKHTLYLRKSLTCADLVPYTIHPSSRALSARLPQVSLFRLFLNSGEQIKQFGIR
jgi:hypothetical protein